ncbi:cytochrome bc1 complex diheme cytochrome c subunit [Pseudoclavibacter sp. 13-3]|uniref:cytochrome bc1 complex diheme cytochrome c subunit n=1 Tax=Pseudoclavibacter sp. 13-3 TaxID=2901228 RepID=UPI001E47C61C|nr:cytochrome c [Pseudoclavibacter sp. 13-3]MCD7101883.1 cytochrome c [Pseudoclavibacter sp. 13-3]
MKIRKNHTSKVGRRSKRRGPLATIGLLAVGLAVTGGGYAAVAQASSTSSDIEKVANTQEQVDEGQKLFQANCATCHGLNLQGSDAGPSLVGVGAASVDFQVGTGRMPMQMQGPQAQVKAPQFTDEQIKALAAYVASVGSGPAIPSDITTKVDTTDSEKVASGAELFRINCAMCHNVAGAGGALTEGKYAPSLMGVSETHIYEAMITGPQNMPVFNDTNLSPEEKAGIISYLKYVEKNQSPGGVDLGSLGPVSEGLFIWIFGIGAIVAFTIWLGARAD